MNEINKFNWIKVWTTKYSFLSLYTFIPGYTTNAYEKVGKGFDHILFNYKEGLATVYRIPEELKEVSKFYAQKSIQDIKFIENSLSELYKIVEEINNIYSLESLLDDAQEFKSLIKNLEDFLPYYLVMLWTPDGLEFVEGEERQKEKVKSLCLEARHKTETFYPDLERFLDKEFKKVDKEINNSFGQYLLTLTPDEIAEYIISKKLPELQILVNRWNLSILYGDNEGIQLYTNTEASALLNELEKTDKNISEFKGTVAMKGKATGKVRLIFRDEDMNKFEEGNILVTTMTRPEWVPVMKKSAAFITDAGGMLCHASIVARELKKPCIIGTQVATRVLKDGDMVEVDADKGIVTIIK